MSRGGTERDASYLLEVACHEAGHAVVSYHLGFYGGPVTIKPDPEMGADGSHSGESEWADGSRDEERIVVLYAGLAAQLRLNPEADRRGASSDYERAADLLPFVTMSKGALEERARNMVEEHWEEIQAVAEALLENETLADGEDDLIMSAVIEGEDWRALLAEFRRRVRMVQP